VAELRRQAASSGDTLPATESVIAMVSRWVNNHQQPSDFYRDLLARTPQPGGKDARAALAIALPAIQSVDSGRPVRLDEVDQR
jgi:predicted dehydrogenase